MYGVSGMLEVLGKRGAPQLGLTFWAVFRERAA